MCSAYNIWFCDYIIVRVSVLSTTYRFFLLALFALFVSPVIFILVTLQNAYFILYRSQLFLEMPFIDHNHV